MNRGDRKEGIVRDWRDRERFLSTLGEACEKTGWQVHAFCLMSNHVHLVLETPQPNLVKGMSWLLGTYSSRFNRRHKVVGRLFIGRYKSLIVDGSQSGYLRTVCDYVHLNPVRAKLLEPDREQSVPGRGYGCQFAACDPTRGLKFALREQAEPCRSRRLRNPGARCNPCRGGTGRQRLSASVAGVCLTGTGEARAQED
jgi:REP element-mobilizing transposase RayT